MRRKRGDLRSGAFVCPYHAWVYNLQGDLLRTSSKSTRRRLRVADFPLYKVKVLEWSGFIFVALADNPPPLERRSTCPWTASTRGRSSSSWSVTCSSKEIRSNWKIFWENYNECLHCPGVHPKLSSLVPIYGRGLLEERDDPDWKAHAGDPDPKIQGRPARAGAHLVVDGTLAGGPFAGLSEEDRKAGHVYLTGLPSMFIVGHADYVRVVRLRPMGPEQTELRVEYLFSRESLARPDFDLRKVVEFTNLVMTEDAEVCEINQRGLRAAPHVRGVVMPEEYVIRQFHEWVDSEMARV